MTRLMTGTLRWLKRHGAVESAQGIKLIVGLGNPGTRYAHNRHNVGFMMVEEFARAHALDFSRRKFNAQIAEGAIAGARVFLAKPQTYMNLSGEAVSKLYKFYKVAPHDLLVIYDDLDLPLGKIRLRAEGSAGGHHGIESIIARIGTSDFPRLRVGIGRPATSTRGRLASTLESAAPRVAASPNPDADVDHVLGNFDASERVVMDETIVRAVEAIDVWLKEGVVIAMNRFN